MFSFSEFLEAFRALERLISLVYRTDMFLEVFSEEESRGAAGLMCACVRALFLVYARMVFLKVSISQECTLASCARDDLLS